MAEVKQETLQRLQDVSRRLHARFVISPLWIMIKEEPIIKEFMAVLADIDSQINPQLCGQCGGPVHEGACYEKP